MSEMSFTAAPEGNVPLYLFRNGRNSHAYEYMGVHNTVHGGKLCTVCRVWAPHAQAVSITGDFCGWDHTRYPLKKIDDAVWEGYTDVPLAQLAVYKLAVTTSDGTTFLKADPYAFCAEIAPGTASHYYDLSDYVWRDHAWYAYKKKNPHYSQPVNIYELHAAAWRRHEDGSLLTYMELADALIPYVKEMGYTHIELMPLTEHPAEDLYGYQPTGYFAPTGRYGTPKELMKFVDRFHQAGIGVIMDWVPAQFSKVDYALSGFDGEPCYEYADPRKGEHKRHGTAVFDYGRNEVISFLISSAVFWINEYHLDGLRVDAVESMLYLDYEREDGEWLPNQHGGKENLEAIAFLQQLNECVFAESPEVMMIAEENTAWPMVTKPAYSQGLGFNYKWNIGWSNDIERYMALDPLFRKEHHNDLTFSFVYAFSENYVLSVSHEGVAGGLGSLYDMMPGTPEQKAAGVRCFTSFMMAHPGKKLQFMGMELGHRGGWDPTGTPQWGLLQYPGHQKLQSFFKNLNSFYVSRSELWEIDFSWDGFSWISNDDDSQSVIAFRRLDKKGDELIAVCNFVPVQRAEYCIGVPYAGVYEEIFNSDAAEFGGSGVTNGVNISTIPKPMHGFEQQISLMLPENAVIFLRCKRKAPNRAGLKRRLFGKLRAES